MLKALPVMICLALFGGHRPAIAETLDIHYFEYPPYYHQLEDGQAAGIIVDLARRVCAAAQVEPKFSFMPAKRIIFEIRDGRPAASLGWFKTPEREEFALFSLPIYVNQPAEVFFLRKDEEKFRPYDTLEGLLQSGHFLFGRVRGFSEGKDLDGMLSKYGDRTVQVAADSIRLLDMLECGRFDFTLMAPEEVDVLLATAGAPREKFMLKAMNDIPQGNLRYIIYSKTVSPDLVRRIDQAILAEIGELPEKP